MGGYQTSGISWYLDGVNPEQYTYASSGKIAYRERTEGAAQQLQEGTGGHWTEYAAAEVAPEFGYYDGIETLLEDAADQLGEGYAVGLGTYYYSESGTAISGHALTVFGFVREWLDQAVSALRALFVADSDDRATGSFTSTAPEERPDEYVMYSLAPYENDSVSSLQLENYPGSYSTVIGMVSTLQPQAAARTGTKDAVYSPNLIPTQLQITDEDGITLTETETGSIVTVEIDFENRAYQGLPEGASIRYEVIVYRDGERVNREEQTVTADALRPNHSISGSLEISLDKPGEYTFEARVLEILSQEGEPPPRSLSEGQCISGCTPNTDCSGQFRRESLR